MANKAIHCDPSALLPYYIRGKVYEDKAQFEDAIKDFQKCMELIEGQDEHPTTLNEKEFKIPAHLIYLALGLAHYKNSQYVEAEKIFTSAIAKFGNKYPDEYVLYYNRGLARFHLGKQHEGEDEALNGALADFTQALELCRPGVLGKKEDLGLPLDLDAADHPLDPEMEIVLATERIHGQRAQVYDKMGNTEAAKEDRSHISHLTAEYCV